MKRSLDVYKLTMTNGHAIKSTMQLKENVFKKWFVMVSGRGYNLVYRKKEKL